MTGGAGVLKSAWMLSHFGGMSFSSRANFVRFLSVALAAMRASFGAAEKCANDTRAPRPLSNRPRRGGRSNRPARIESADGCYTGGRGASNEPNAAVAAPRRSGNAVHAERERARLGAGRLDPEP